MPRGANRLAHVVTIIHFEILTLQLGSTVDNCIYAPYSKHTHYHTFNIYNIRWLVFLRPGDKFVLTNSST